MLNFGLDSGVTLNNYSFSPLLSIKDDDNFSSEADTVVSEMTRDTPLLAEVRVAATGGLLIAVFELIKPGEKLAFVVRNPFSFH